VLQATLAFDPSTAFGTIFTASRLVRRRHRRPGREVRHGRAWRWQCVAHRTAGRRRVNKDTWQPGSTIVIDTIKSAIDDWAEARDRALVKPSAAPVPLLQYCDTSGRQDEL
jgi:hypothetical protein